MKNILLLVFLFVLVFITPCLGAESIYNLKYKSGYEDLPHFGGPGSVASDLRESDEVKSPRFRYPRIDQGIKPWFDWKRGINEKYGLELGLAHTIVYQAVDSAPSGAEDSAASGVLRFSGKWVLLNRGEENTGSLVFNVDYRHRFMDIAPADLGFSAGYLGIPAVNFSNVYSILGDLNWQQRLNNGRSGVIVGRYDPNDFFDVLGYANPWTSFQNLAILFNTSIALPDWSTGIGAGHYFKERWYLLAGVNDVNGTAAETYFFKDYGELYTTAEVGWSPSRDERYLKNAHVTLWHSDAREEAGIEESEGVALGANWTFDKRWMPFVRAGWSDGTAPSYSKSVTAGMIYYFPTRSDLMGFGLNWGAPSDSSLREQWTGELFYRLQIAENLSITPDLQLFIDPALNPAEDEIWLFGLRVRITL